MAIAGLVLLIWLIPIKRYTLPVQLPFRLEPYRLAILGLLVVLLLGVITGRARITLAGHAKPVLLLAFVALGAQVANLHAINSAGLQTQSLKSLSFFISFLVAFALVTSTLRDIDDIRAVVKAMVVGAAIVAVAALYEGKFHDNLFDGLDRWIPFLQDTGEDRFNFRGGRLRVRASAQHPIALAAALLLCAPLAIYLARHARTKMRSRGWLGVAILLVGAALATVSRTAVVMLVAMVIVGLIFRGERMLRYWPLLLAIVAVTHFAAPGAMRHLYKAFTPTGGLIQEQRARSGQEGSGRIADIRPGLRVWKRRPLLGRGLGTNPTRGEPLALEANASLQKEARLRIIYDDQYLNTLVALGVLGFLGVIWFVWGGVRKLGQAARRTVGDQSDLLVCCTASCAAFGAALAVFDAFSFVQASLLFFLIAALGLRTRALVGS